MRLNSLLIIGPCLFLHSAQERQPCYGKTRMLYTWRHEGAPRKPLGYVENDRRQLKKPIAASHNVFGPSLRSIGIWRFKVLTHVVLDLSDCDDPPCSVPSMELTPHLPVPLVVRIRNMAV